MTNESSKLLAQFNIARLRHGPDDPRLVSFAAGAKMINRAAASAPGRVWSQQDIVDEVYFATRSVWESLDSLHSFVYSGIHRRYLNRRAEWFVENDSVSTVLWWVEHGEIPALDDARGRLETLRRQGPSNRGFGFANALEFKR